MTIKCPNCSAEVDYIKDDCEFCPECGSELKIQTANKIDRDSLSEKSKAAADSLDNNDTFNSSIGECKYLRVEYNRNLFFLSGTESIIKLKITPLDDSLQNILLFMETLRYGNNSRRQVQIKEILKKDQPFFLQIPFNPESSLGNLSIIFYIGCQINGKFNYYQFTAEHKVYDAQQSGSSLFNQITINQEFTTNQAADINYHDSIGDALRKMANKTMTVNEMIDRLNDLTPDYQIRVLTPTTWKPEDILVKGNLYPTEKLLLEWNKNAIFLFNKKCVKFGRDSEQVDIVVRCGRGKLSLRDYPNSTVSRKHASILYCEDSVKLFDHSSYGTYINGRKPDSAGIPLENSATVEFGDIHWQMNIQKCMMRLPHNICQTCNSHHIKSMTFSRIDHEPEYYMLIWQCCELGRVIEELSDWTVFSRDGYFFIRTPSQDFFHLRPGQIIEDNGQKIQVRYL